MVAGLACDAPYEAPCRVTRHDIPISEQTIGGRDSVSLARREDGFVASWLRVDSPDAGPDSTPTIGGFDVVDLDAHGIVVRRESVAAPAELRTRKGSVETADIARENGATLLHWVESTTSTDADGRVRTAFALKGAYGDRVVAPATAACDRCAMRVAVVAFATESIAIVSTTPDVVLAAVGAPPSPVVPAFSAIHFRRDGTTTTEPLPWLSVEPPASASGLAAASSGSLSAAIDAEGRLVIESAGRTWLADASLRPLAGPIDLPIAGARPLFGPSGDVAIAWAISATEEGRSAEQFSKREVFVGNGVSRERLSYGRAILAADRKDSELGVVFESAGRMFFAASSPAGKKRGGDVFVAAIGDRSSEYGAFAPEDASALAVTATGAFTLVTLGRGALTTTEIVCAP